MKDRADLPIAVRSRRQMIARIAAGLGALAANSSLSAGAQQAMKEIPATSANKERTSLHYQVDLKSAPEKVYAVLVDPKLFATLTGLGAEIDAKEGGAFSLFGGLIVGRNVELVANQRIVQAWRPTSWEAGVYSIVHFELKPSGSNTAMTLDHTGFPKGYADHLNDGWHSHYLDALQKYFA